MTTSRNNERLRYKYGICLNDNCEKCKSKEVQEIPARRDFVCQNPDCGKPLRECPPPKKGFNKSLIIGIIAAIVVLGGILFAVFAGGGKTEAGNGPGIAVVDSDSIRATQQAEQQLAEQQRLQDMQDSLQAVADSLTAEQARQDSIEQARQESAAKAQSPKPNAPRMASGTKDFGYATFKGSWPNDVNGRMVFKTSHVIDSRDSKGRVAEPGDYVIGEWSDGHLVQGIWYGSDNVVKGSIIIGK